MALLALSAPASFLASLLGNAELAAEAGALTGNTGFTFPNTGLVAVRITIGSAGACNYTVVRADGTTDAPVALANSTNYVFGPYDPAIYSNNAGLVQVNISVVTGNAVGVYKVPTNAGFNHLHSAFPAAPGSTDS